ncbi:MULTISPECIES: Na+/H+ antiporter subunit E [unclassified Streptomyces]|uniref:Na+/H+ antiporter subunit E n=1 Tax=unclassified Streptomyces TaxID=2593676 RepID=UPI00278C77C2|nr:MULTISPECIES: Na+/H+ antiporter subunit E [unclassified Streptomyces]
MNASRPKARWRRIDLPLIAWLTVIWMLLWSGLTWGNAISGVVVAIALCLVFPLPAVELDLRLRPIGIVRLAGYLLYDMTSSTVTVTWQTLRARPGPSAVIAVPLRCRTDLMIAATSVAVSSVPGGALVEVNGATATLFLHVSHADDPKAVERARVDVRRLENLVVRAFGTREEIDRLAQAATDELPEGKGPEA